MTINSKKTSSKVAKLTSETLSNSNSSAIAKRLAASALAQTHSTKQTSAEMETVAGKVLQSDKYSEETKALAASVVSQSNQARGE